jgi:hypothetical protein
LPNPYGGYPISKIGEIELPRHGGSHGKTITSVKCCGDWRERQPTMDLLDIGSTGYQIGALGIVAFAVSFFAVVRWWTDLLGRVLAFVFGITSLVLLVSAYRSLTDVQSHGFLVVRAIVFGSDVAKFEKDLRGASDEFSFQLWARNGAIDRLHNIVTYLRRSDQRRQELRRLQKDLAGDDNIFTLEVIADGKTRWNSVFLMIKRGK